MRIFVKAPLLCIGIMTPTPGKIKEVVKVPFSRPRKRQSLFVSQDYIILRSKLLARFSEEMQKDLEKQEKELITWSI